jgi:glycosyltransferase involved in cell wall biosynthesis
MSQRASKKYNILYTTSYGYMKGGGQWSLYHLLKYLNRDGFRPVLLCPEEGPLVEKARAIAVDVVIQNIGRIRHLNPLSLWKLLRTLKREKIHLVHTDAPTQTLYAGIAAKIVGIPLLWHIRASDPEWFWDRVLSSLIARHVLVAESIRRRFEWFEKSKKAVVIHNGLDIEEFDTLSVTPAGLRKAHALDRKTVLLGCLGRLEPKKGQELAVAALRYVDTNNVKLMLVGEGEEAYVRRFKELTRELGVSQKVIYTGYREDIPSLLQEIDILVFPTLTEAFSRVILESMAASIPIIATDVGGNSEAVVHGITGYIVPPQDVQALANRINELINDRGKRKKMGKAARARVKDLFTMERHVALIEKLYHEVLTLAE